MKKKKLLYLIDRDNWQKDDALNHKLVHFLKQTECEIKWEDPAGNLLYRLRSFENNFKHMPAIIKQINLRVFQGVYGLFNWKYFTYLFGRPNQPVKLRSEKLKKSLEKISEDKDVIILSRSAGGRYASLIADDINIKHIICLSYPFRHPDKDEEPSRFIHLEKLQTPMLIIQGNKDEYGGLEVLNKYSLSENTELLFVNADHNFILNKSDWDKVLSKIANVIL